MKKLYYLFIICIFLFSVSCANDKDKTDKSLISTNTDTSIIKSSTELSSTDNKPSTESKTIDDISSSTIKDSTGIISTTTSKKTTTITKMDASDINLDYYVDNLINNTDSYIPSWNQEGFKGRWNYIDGVFLKSIIDYYNKKKDIKYLSFVKNYVD